jgi:hypothetical protein
MCGRFGATVIVDAHDRVTSRRCSCMADRPRLSDIASLVNDTTPDRGRVALRTGGIVVVIIGAIFQVFAADMAWETRKVSHFADVSFGILAFLCLALPIVIGIRAARRLGSDILVLLALIIPVVTWIVVAIVFAVCGALNGENVF